MKKHPFLYSEQYVMMIHRVSLLYHKKVKNLCDLMELSTGYAVLSMLYYNIDFKYLMIHGMRWVC